jgi:hypothetical protein
MNADQRRDLYIIVASAMVFLVTVTLVAGWIAWR